MKCFEDIFFQCTTYTYIFTGRDFDKEEKTFLRRDVNSSKMDINSSTLHSKKSEAAENTGSFRGT